MSMRDIWRNGITSVIALAIVLGLAACGGGGGSTPPPPPPTGSLAVTITDSAEESPIPNARVTIIDASSGDIIDILTTDATGKVAKTLLVGQIQLRVAAQGYEPSPASDEGVPMPFAIVGGQTTPANFALTPLADAESLGWITGQALHSNGVANALILANDGNDNWYTTASDSDGTYVLFNIPAGDLSVTALRGGYNFTTVDPVSVTAGMATEGIEILSENAAASLSGMITFLASQNSEVDVTLLHPETGAVIPGLRAFTSNRNYTLNGIPNGTFEAIASLETDGYVLDPDRVAKFGVPLVTVADGTVTTANPLNFDVTGAVSLIAPVNFQEMPINALTFRWNAYSSTKNYVLEMINDHGEVIWGGSIPEPGSNYTVGTATQVTFDPDWASEPLVEGKLYRVRVYAEKDGVLISASEDLVGVFKVGPAL